MSSSSREWPRGSNVLLTYEIFLPNMLFNMAVFLTVLSFRLEITAALILVIMKIILRTIFLLFIAKSVSSWQTSGRLLGQNSDSVPSFFTQDLFFDYEYRSWQNGSRIPPSVSSCSSQTLSNALAMSNKIGSVESFNKNPWLIFSATMEASSVLIQLSV